MAIIKQTKILNPPPFQREPEPLTPAGKLCKEQLSHIPSWVERANGGNELWNSLASSRFNIYKEESDCIASPEITPPSEIARTIISNRELVELFKIETKKQEIFSKIYILIRSTPPDKTGCNWMINISNGEKELLEKFYESTRELNSLYRKKYNLPAD